MPNLSKFAVALDGLLFALATLAVRLYRASVRWIVEAAIPIAFPPPDWVRTPFAFEGLGERLVYARARARVGAFTDRRLQREHQVLGAGCGLRLAM